MIPTHPASLLTMCHVVYAVTSQVQAYKSHCDYEKQLSEAQAYLKEVQSDPEMAEFAREEIADLQVGWRLQQGMTRYNRYLWLQL